MGVAIRWFYLVTYTAACSETRMQVEDETLEANKTKHISNFPNGVIGEHRGMNHR